MFHGVVALACVGWAVLRLRGLGLAQTSAVARPKLKSVLPRRRPPVGERPVFWKEVRVEGGLRFGWLGRILVGLLVGVSFVPMITMFYFKFFDMQNRFSYSSYKWQEFGQDVNNYWLRPVNVLVSVLMLLGVAVRAAAAVGGERDRDTLVSLMGTPLTTQEILWGKWWGSLLSVRLFVLWLGAAWAVGLVTGGVNLLAVVLQMLAWLAPAMFLASVGLYFSAASKTTLRATTWTLLTAVFALGGHWLVLFMCCYFPLFLVAHGPGDIQYAIHFELGLTPPAVFAWVPFREWNELNWFGDGFPGFAVLGMFLWCVGAAAVGFVAHERFMLLTHRNAWAPGPAPADVALGFAERVRRDPQFEGEARP
jgi:ABC-type transport system involved in multi-copper enzyme maturation permease subunit